MTTFHLRYLKHIDWLSLFITTIIAGIGLACVYSATYTNAQPYSPYFTKQLTGTLIGLGIYAVFCVVDFQLLCRWGYFLYFATLGLLIFALIKGSVGMGAQRWIDLKIIKFQPSELAKLFLPAFVVYYLEADDGSEFTFQTFIPILIVMAISLLLILKQPDLGTALIILFSAIIMLWYAGIAKKFFLWSIILTALAAPLLYACLKPYQKKRIEVFLGAGSDRVERYQVEQSKIAIGSGGMWGKGFLQGTQNRLAFLPERRTDFIFSVFCEEWGLVGASILMLLYAILIIRILLTIQRLRAFFAQLLAIGLLAPVAFSIIINIGMVTDLLPVVGIPLPLMSYGLSHSWITYAALGWINGIIMRRFSLETS